MNTVVINVLGLVLIGAIVWWFWLWKPARGATAVQGVVNVEVGNGTYTPAVIEATAGETLTLNVMRRDPSPCAEYLVIDGLDVNEQLPVEREKRIVIKDPPPGDYAMHCQMNMYQGRLRVK